MQLKFKHCSSAAMLALLLANSGAIRALAQGAVQRSSSSAPAFTGMTGSVEGRVENAITGDVIPNATVRMDCMRVKVQNAACGRLSGRSGPDGAFRFDSVVPGSYLFFALAERFVAMKGLSETATVEAGQQGSPVVLRLNPEANMSGKVVDEAGSAVTGASVEALTVNRSRGHAWLVPISRARTDSSGAYTLSRLTPGRYYISVQPAAQNKAKSTIRFYYPSALSVDDTSPLVVEAGQRYEGIEIRMRAVVLHRIEGKVTGVPGADDKQQKLGLRLEPRNSIESGLIGRQVRLGTDGTFALDGVVPGSYVLLLRGSTPLDGADARARGMMFHLLAKQEIDVAARDVTGLELLIPPPITITGRVAMEGSGTQELVQTEIALRAADGFGSSDHKNVRPQSDGTFRFAPCDPVQYAVHVTAPPGTYVQTIEFNRQDAMTHLMDLSGGVGGELLVSLRKGPAEVSGTIQGAWGTGDQAAGRVSVVLIPGNWNPDVWQDVTQKESGDGKFLFQNLAPGQYVLVAVEWANNNMDLWQDPEFIRALASEGEHVDLQEGEHQQAALSVVSDSEVKRIIARLGFD